MQDRSEQRNLKEGHSWDARINTRVYGSGCPYCKGLNTNKLNKTDLLITNKELLSEWDFEKNFSIDVNKILLGSIKEVWWNCNEENHSWKCNVRNRFKGSKCPYCMSIFKTHPELIKEIDFIKNKEFGINLEILTYGSTDSIWWKCLDKGHSWQATVNNRAKEKGTKCPYCTNQKVCADNNVLNTYPSIKEEWDYEKNGNLKPEDLTPGSGKRVWLYCMNGHSYDCTLKNRVAEIKNNTNWWFTRNWEKYNSF